MNYEELTLAGIDCKELLDRFMNNGKLVKMILGKFLSDGTRGKLEQAVAQADAEAAEFACHSLKGVCGNLAMKELFALLQEQLRLFRTGEQEAAFQMTAQILEKYDQAQVHIVRWLSQQ